MEDDVYKGWFIPAGATVMENTWCAILFHGLLLAPNRVLKRAVTRDESAYPNAHVFNPGRFIKDGQINPDVKDPEQLVFGYGRRYLRLRWTRVSHFSDNP